MKNLTVFCTERKVLVKQSIYLLGEERVEYGEEMFLIASYNHKTFTSGKAFVVSNGEQTVSADSSLFELIN